MGNFSLKTEGTRTKAARGLISWLPYKFRSLKIWCIFFQMSFPFLYSTFWILCTSLTVCTLPSSFACCFTSLVSIIPHPPPPPHIVCTHFSLRSEPVVWQKSPAGTRQTDGKNLVWFGEIERKLTNDYLYLPFFLLVILCVWPYINTAGQCRYRFRVISACHRLNRELDLQSLFGLHGAQMYSSAERPRNPHPPPAFGLIYEGAIGQLR